MSDSQNFSGFGQFVPGFDFLQNLAKGASEAMPQMPTLSSWIAPTLSVEELDKRISELRAVLFWLEQNQKALGATIQALEVQKMTLATLKGMDLTLADLAEAMKVKPAPASPAAPAPTEAAADAAGTEKKGATRAAGGAKSEPAQVVDPVQWWTALTHQFQQIAANALQQGAQAAAAAAPATTGQPQGRAEGSPAPGEGQGAVAAKPRAPAARKRASTRPPGKRSKLA
ncbi:PhaM family polyhydroxyalkanoate granule multifunctional regulatory protein [Ramlibacter rhizophilus]|uniref:Uncharacterized protein n=1 Tax=Ramlibacter rhizophilus TaxID=1781167 RepID=A0A4Z0BER2_9BURK|nr:PhaM family polyhydroxyalkanoate granule multifunctional regulatory protein [Ramlibacter rhizophilus]TFY97835.1 hypothetical protein EZ242_15340 [Ramlibacter rhizophilus]